MGPGRLCPVFRPTLPKPWAKWAIVFISIYLTCLIYIIRYRLKRASIAYHMHISRHSCNYLICGRQFIYPMCRNSCTARFARPSPTPGDYTRVPTGTRSDIVKAPTEQAKSRPHGSRMGPGGRAFLKTLSIFPKVHCSEGSLSRRFIVPKKRFIVPKVYWSEGSFIRNRGSLLQRFIVPK